MLEKDVVIAVLRGKKMVGLLNPEEGSKIAFEEKELVAKMETPKELKQFLKNKKGTGEEAQILKSRRVS